MKLKKFRDLSLVSIDDDKLLVIACDSSGAIGNKEKDVVKVDPSIIGYFTCHVSLCEILAVGAKPISIVNTLSVEMNNTGKKIISGIKKALKQTEIAEDIIVTGSTEENFEVCQTGMGITAIGAVDKNKFNKVKAKKDELIIVAGLPKVGNEVDINDRDLLTIKKILQLRENPYVSEILPVGSKGILYELNELARTNNLKYILEDKINLDLKKSAGPATCALLTVNKNGYDKLKNTIDIPLNIIGSF
ncbi:MAG: selenophosphate synthase [Firmicutes bacterium]|nr:selenophosphate synthase [Bacillota bacterium]